MSSKNQQSRTITEAELKQHNKKDDCWVAFQGAVYNITPFLSRHPGGQDCILADAGGDMTEAYMRRHYYVNPSMIEKYKIGYLTY